MANLMRFPELAPWRPFSAIDNRIRALFEELAGEEFFTGVPEVKTWSPAVELVETNDEMLLTAELPGMTREDIEINLEDNVLTLRGEKVEERKKEREDEKVRYHLWERTYGKFQRSFTLPGNVDADKIRAEFVNGVLKVHMPKTAESKARRIEIAAK